MGVIHILIDAVSRANFFRKFPKSVEYLEKFYQHDELYSKIESGEFKEAAVGFQFFKGQASAQNTNTNFRLIRYGQDTDLGNKPLHKVFEERGFFTSYASNMCGYYEQLGLGEESVSDNAFYTHADHEFLGPACDEASFPKFMPFQLL